MRAYNTRMNRFCVMAAVAALSFAPLMAGAKNNGIQLMDGLSPNDLARLSDTLKTDPEAYDGLIAVGKCAQKKLDQEGMEELRAFSETASHNVRKYCDERKFEKAASYAKERFKIYSKTDSFKELSTCVQTQEDADNLTFLIMSQMGVRAIDMDYSNICENFGRRY